MSDSKGEIDPRSTYAIRVQAMDMAITARHKDYDASLIEMAIEIEGFLLGDNSRLAPSPEQPEQPSTETVLETSHPNVADGTTTTKLFSDGTARIIATDASGGSIETVSGAPITPMTDLSGIDYSPAFEGYQPNGAIPETD